jgi:transposase
MTKRTPPYSPEVRERAVHMVFDHRGDYASQYAAIRSIAQKIGCSGETLRKWIRQAERDQGLRTGLTTDERERLKALERENRELQTEVIRQCGPWRSLEAVAFATLEFSNRAGSVNTPRICLFGI